MRKILSFMVVMIFCWASVGLVIAETSQKGGMEQGGMSEQQAVWFCPWCGSPGLGRGMMGPGIVRPGWGRGMGMMGPGMHHGWARNEASGDTGRKIRPLDKDEAEMLMKNYIVANPNLKIIAVTEKDDIYTGEVVTKDDSLVEKLEVDKNTGWMKLVY